MHRVEHLPTHIAVSRRCDDDAHGPHFLHDVQRVCVLHSPARVTHPANLRALHTARRRVRRRVARHHAPRVIARGSRCDRSTARRLRTRRSGAQQPQRPVVPADDVHGRRHLRERADLRGAGAVHHQPDLHRGRAARRGSTTRAARPTDRRLRVQRRRHLRRRLGLRRDQSLRTRVARRRVPAKERGLRLCPGGSRLERGGCVSRARGRRRVARCARHAATLSAAYLCAASSSASYLCAACCAPRL